jgi:hypothetical protein
MGPADRVTGYQIFCRYSKIRRTDNNDAVPRLFTNIHQIEGEIMAHHTAVVSLLIAFGLIFPVTANAEQTLEREPIAVLSSWEAADGQDLPMDQASATEVNAKEQIAVVQRCVNNPGENMVGGVLNPGQQGVALTKPPVDCTNLTSTCVSSTACTSTCVSQGCSPLYTSCWNGTCYCDIR